MDLSIIIPQYNTFDLTTRLLANLDETLSRQFSFEILVVDDGSNACGSPEADIPFTIYLRLTNGGFSAAVNSGIEQSKGLYVAIFNNDTMVSPWWDDVLIRNLGNPPCDYNVGMLAGQLVDTQEEIRYMEPEWLFEKRPINIWRNGAPWVFPRSVLETVGKWDEQFYPGNFEEIDYFMRMAAMGYIHGTITNVKCWHQRHGTLSSQWSDGEFWRLYGENKDRFLKKWGSVDLYPGVYQEAYDNGKWGSK